MAHIKKLFFVPIGLPGTGKTTLAKHLESTSNKMFYHHSLNTPLFVEFKKISYDKLLTDNQKAFSSKHPEVPFHEVIDIIRGQTD